MKKLLKIIDKIILILILGMIVVFIKIEVNRYSIYIHKTRQLELQRVVARMAADFCKKGEGVVDMEFYTWHCEEKEGIMGL